MQVILEQLPAIEQAARELRESLLANLVVIGETPAPTFGEQDRIDMLLSRFVEHGLQDCSTDEAGNGLSVLPGSEGDRDILVAAHADTVFPPEVDHTVLVESDGVVGPGLSDNSLGLAILATLPDLLEALDLELKANLILMGDVKSLGHGNLEGMRFFLEHTSRPLAAGLCLEGVRLGRLSYASVGMLRGEVTCEVAADYDWTQFGTTNAIILLNEVVSRILEIPLSQKPLTTITLGQIEGGNSFNRIPTGAVLRFEIQSDKPGQVAQIGEQIGDICGEISSRSGANLRMHEVATRSSGGLPYSHPLPKVTRQIQHALNLTPQIAPSVSELAAFIKHDIPALTVGLTEARKERTKREKVLIEPMFQGLAQLVGVLMAIDQGYCHDR
jgi:acetylornithine deacetylase/succinyl-diaminopimelate desuccinylase-like protein